MSLWKVWNRHPEGRTHKEKFKDRLIEIPANEFILMDYEEAVQFRGQYFPMLKNAQGAPDPKGFKVIHLERHDEGTAVELKEFICHLDGAKFPTQALLDKYLKDNYSEQTFKDEALEEEIKKTEQAKKGPGRPPKDKSA